MENKKDLYDIFVIGGGINGAGIARDASGRGLSVLLCEKDDLAQGTSSRSGKLVHGGLRYLEYYEFRLVREALTEREVLLKNSPHLVYPLRFVLPHSNEQRPAWLVRLGLFLYDHLGGRKILPKSHSLDLQKTGKGSALKKNFKKGFEFSDCWIDDSRMVVLNAIDALNHGAHILPRVEFIEARRENKAWSIKVKLGNGKIEEYKSKCIVNASGPWVENAILRSDSVKSNYKVRLVKGSHLVIKKFWEGDHCFLFQNSDKRVIFLNPYEKNLALLGTTDIPYQGKPEAVSAEKFEIQYLLDSINRYLEKPITPDQVIDSFSGVRPLFDDGKGNPSAVTRDYLFEIDDQNGLPMLSIFGGKITTFRELSERALQKLRPYFPKMGKDWTVKTKLPGGDFPDGDFNGWLKKQYSKYSFLDKYIVEHYGKLYGTLMDVLLKNVQSSSHLGKHFGGNLYQIEAEYLIKSEWARTSEDILERRTKHYLHLTTDEVKKFEQWFQGEISNP